MSIRGAALAALVLTAFETPAAEAPYEVALAGYLCNHTPLPLMPVGVEWLGGTHARTGGARVNVIAAAPAGAIYGVDTAQQILRVRHDGNARLATLPQGHTGHAMTVDRSGNIYVLAAVRQGHDAIDVYGADGTFRTTWSLDATDYAYDFSAIDLASDQCTLVLSRHGVLRRFDVCRGTFGPDIGLVHAGGFRIMPDGGLLILYDNELRRLDSSGNVVRRYERTWDWPLPRALALANGGTTAWVASDGCEGVAEHIDLDTGALLATFRTEQASLNSIVPWNAWTAAFGTHAFDAATVPATSHAALIALAALLAFAAYRRIT